VEFLVERLREPQILASTKRIYIQVYGFDFIPASLLREKYSNVYVVHIVRDPRTFVPSYMNWMRTRRRSFIANKLVPGWHPAGDKVGDYSREQWRRMDAFQRVCWHWSFKNRLIQELFGGDPRYYQVRFEDLFLTESPSALESLLDWCSIPYTGNHESIIDRPLNVSRKKYFPSWDALPHERKRELLVICQREMERFGYYNNERLQLK
jgi:hypothetical protein